MAHTVLVCPQMGLCNMPPHVSSILKHFSIAVFCEFAPLGPLGYWICGAHQNATPDSFLATCSKNPHENEKKKMVGTDMQCSGPKASQRSIEHLY